MENKIRKLEEEATIACGVGDYKKAEKLYYKLIDLDKNKPHYFEMLGECHKACGKAKRAANCEKRAKHLRLFSPLSQAGPKTYSVVFSSTRRVKESPISIPDEIPSLLSVVDKTNNVNEKTP